MDGTLAIRYGEKHGEEDSVTTWLNLYFHFSFDDDDGRDHDSWRRPIHFCSVLFHSILFYWYRSTREFIYTNVLDNIKWWGNFMDATEHRRSMWVCVWCDVRFIRLLYAMPCVCIVSILGYSCRMFYVSCVRVYVCVCAATVNWDRLSINTNGTRVCTTETRHSFGSTYNVISSRFLFCSFNSILQIDSVWFFSCLILDSPKSCCRLVG